MFILIPIIVVAMTTNFIDLRFRNSIFLVIWNAKSQNLLIARSKWIWFLYMGSEDLMFGIPCQIRFSMIARWKYANSQILNVFFAVNPCRFAIFEFLESSIWNAKSQITTKRQPLWEKVGVTTIVGFSIIFCSSKDIISVKDSSRKGQSIQLNKYNWR